MTDRMTDRNVPPPIDELLAQRRWVRALAGHLVQPDRADDIEQAAWLAAIKRPPRHGASQRGWLATVLRNTARKAGRSEARRARHEAAAPLRPPAATTADLVAAAELQQRVARAVLDLDEPLLLLLEDLRGIGEPGVARRFDAFAGRSSSCRRVSPRQRGTGGVAGAHAGVGRNW
jgi:DNA-directed RNA polymerase specialized sigma24 family protein